MLLSLLPVVIVIFYIWASRVHQTVNEPDPSSVSKSHIEEMIGGRGVTTVVHELFYMNRDVNAFIFRGLIVSEHFDVDSFESNVDVNVSEDVFKLVFPSRFGMIRVRKIGNDYLVCVVVSTTDDEWLSTRDRIETAWDATVLNLDLAEDSKGHTAPAGIPLGEGTE